MDPARQVGSAHCKLTGFSPDSYTAASYAPPTTAIFRPCAVVKTVDLPASQLRHNYQGTAHTKVDEIRGNLWASGEHLQYSWRKLVLPYSEIGRHGHCTLATFLHGSTHMTRPQARSHRNSP